MEDVDNILNVTNQNYMNEILHTKNDINPSIRFAIEVGRTITFQF